jgi:hypothetical protein
MKRLHCGIAVAMFVAACSDSGDGAEDAAPFRPATIGLNDVSVLFPLPPASDVDALLSLSSATARGSLLPKEHFDAIAPIAAAAAADPAIAFGRWRIVAARIDPCFPDGRALSTHAVACKRQIRLAAQPIAVTSTGVEALDHAIHLLYELPEAEFTTLAAEWVSLQTERTRSPDVPLGVHPTLLEEGLRGKTSTQVQQLIVDHAGKDNLVKVTFTVGGGTTWTFGQLARTSSGTFEVERIPSIDAQEDGSSQFVQTSDTGAGFFIAGPQSPSVQKLDVLLDLKAPEPEIKEAFQAAFDLENPLSGVSSATVDCVSCHIAGRVKERAFFLGAKADGASAYVAARNGSLAVSNETRRMIRQVRALGYNRNEPVLSLRAVNESDAVATALMTILNP